MAKNGQNLQKVDLDPSVAGPVAKRPPRGTFSAKVDDKGRLKFPSAVLEFLSGQKHFFLTTLDKKSARLYPAEMWALNEAALEAKERAGNRNAGKMLYLANFYGKEEEIDDSGRVTLKLIMRKELNFEGQDLCLFCKPGGRIDIFTEKSIREVNDSLSQLSEEEMDDLMTGIL